MKKNDQPRKNTMMCRSLDDEPSPIPNRKSSRVTTASKPRTMNKIDRLLSINYFSDSSSDTTIPISTKKKRTTPPVQPAAVQQQQQPEPCSCHLLRELRAQQEKQQQQLEELRLEVKKQNGKIDKLKIAFREWGSTD